ncbi:TetR/AcrR family transcriptional regulator [Nocardia flavorosea]|uniref:TetR/AcrR family transcriptional regulator n=1 Tax=Nocardia flavorosea TaxID=53429 RepID=UPI002458CFD8|nr:TetR family transcriptional regulator C-terminal domain-containing protein [Nocardia flavorosea]
MPKVVDHAQRRAELARAVWAVIGREGIEGATVRRVAEEAGVSVGGLRHYFDSQQGLLRFAAEAMAGSVQARVAEHLRADLPDVERARLILEEFLPLDEPRSVEVDVWLACLVRSRFDASFDELRRISGVGERHLCRLALAYCRGVAPPGDIGQRLDTGLLEQQAERLHLFMDGLTLQAAMYPTEFPPEQVRMTLRRELGLLARGEY